MDYLLIEMDDFYFSDLPNKITKTQVYRRQLDYPYLMYLIFRYLGNKEHLITRSLKATNPTHNG